MKKVIENFNKWQADKSAMKTIDLTYSGETITYKVADESNPRKPVLYKATTPDEVIEVLERARKSNTRLEIRFGDTETGRDWNDVYDCTGYVGLSCGTDGRYPLLIHNTRSLGGGSLMSYCIVKIMESRGKKVLYQHPKYHKV